VFHKAFWRDAAERLVGAAVASVATSVAATGNLLAVDWPTALGIAGAIAVGSLAASVGKAKAPIGDPGAPTLVSTGRHARD